jgi:hypothetical protein
MSLSLVGWLNESIHILDEKGVEKKNDFILFLFI